MAPTVHVGRDACIHLRSDYTWALRCQRPHLELSFASLRQRRAYKYCSSWAGDNNPDPQVLYVSPFCLFVV